MYSDVTVTEALSGTVIQSQTHASLASFMDPAAAPYELCFAGLIPPLGFASFVLTRGAASSSSSTDTGTGTDTDTDSDTGYVRALTTSQLGEAGLEGPDGFVVLRNPFLAAQFSSETGGLVQLQRNSFPSILISVNQSFAAYADIGNQYEFIPLNNTPTPTPQDGVTAYFVNGPLVSIAFQVYGPTLVHAVRLYNCSDCNYLQSAFIVGPLELNSAVVNRFHTSIDSGNVMYTDDGGLEMIKRVYQPDVVGGMGANFYPHVFAAYLRSASSPVQLTAIAEQPHGIASSQPGELQVMVHRRTAYGCCGNSEPLNDTSVLTDTLLITLDSEQDSSRMQSRVTTEANTPYVVVACPGVVQLQAPLFSPVKESLAPTVRILSLNSVDADPNGQVILRVFNGDQNVGATTTVDLPSLFDTAVFGLASVTPTTLSMMDPVGPAAAPQAFDQTALQINSFYASFKAPATGRAGP